MASHKQLITDIYNHLNESEIYASYSAKVTRHFSKRDMATKWVAAIAACGPFIQERMGSSRFYNVKLITFNIPMPRPTRIEYDGAFHHVMNRGRNHENIFHDKRFFDEFIKCLKEASEQFDAVIHAYC